MSPGFKGDSDGWHTKVDDGLAQINRCCNEPDLAECNTTPAVGDIDGWQHNVPSAGQAPRRFRVAPGTSPTSWYTTPENIQHIAYVGTDRLIHENFCRIN
jgi:hypothetical protein